MEAVEPAQESVVAVQPPAAVQAGSRGSPPHLASMQAYHDLYQHSITGPHAFWAQMARRHLQWDRDFTSVQSGDFTAGNVEWFSDGRLNVCVNCVDRHAAATPDKVAIVWEADSPDDSVSITYATLLQKVCQLANTLLSLGVKRGDTVAIYMPMIPEAAYAMLACARIGAMHSVVFAGFSAEALRARINDAGCQVVLTANQGFRGSKPIHLKSIVDDALTGCPGVSNVVVFRRSAATSAMTAGRDAWWHDVVDGQPTTCPPVSMGAEDPLFMLYTSGSTGQPKGLVHTQAGYLLGTMLTLLYTFDFHPGTDVWGCVADVGWITGHSYIVYGPLGLGATTLMFESVPTYPDAGRYWQMVDRHRITHFYTAPTAIRALKRLGDELVKQHRLDSLRVLGTVGEPINPEAWQWYFDVVGRGKCAVVDTYWQTETGSFVIAPYAAVTPTKPGAATLPQFGIVPVLLDPTTGAVQTDPSATGVLCIQRPWPSMARTVYKAHQRYLDTYFRPYPGFYFTGDGASRDHDSYYWIRGRVDDVINVSGHRLSTAEIESALVMHDACAEAAVVGVHDDITGQAICAFCCMKPATARSGDGGDAEMKARLVKELVAHVRTHIGPFAAPRRVVIVPELPKTRSGKIMRRILRKIMAHELDQLGDTSTLADPTIIDTIVALVQ